MYSTKVEKDENPDESALHLWTIKTAQVPFKFKGNVADIWINRHASRSYGVPI
jgi:hypothetical protein